ncbi:MAG: VanZ family protein [Verrucomicrobiota bacterium]
MKIPPLFLKRWLPAAAWGAVILCASTGIASGEHTAGFLQSLFAWLHFGTGSHPERLGEANFFLRKSAHFLQFVIYALLVWRGFRLAPSKESRPGRIIFWAVGSATVLAVASEGIQLFFPARSPLFSDVILDVCGAAVGILIVLALRAISKAPEELPETERA